MSERYSDIYMVDPVLVDDSFDNSGELSDEARHKVKYVLEETLEQMGIPVDDVLFCPREIGVVDGYIESMSAALQDLSEEIAEKQTRGVYEEDPSVKELDYSTVVQLKNAIEDPRPDWEFVGIESFVNFSGMDNPVDEGAFMGSFGVYDAKKLRDRLDGMGSVSARAEEIEEAKLFDFVPRYMETEELATWAFRQVFKKAAKQKATIFEAKPDDKANNQELMDWLGDIAEANGKLSSQTELLELLGRYGIDIAIN